MSTGFLVTVHDVHPVFCRELDAILPALQTRLGTRFSLAVTPQYEEALTDPADWAFLARVEADLLLHGITHRRARNVDPYSIYAGFADEWGGVPHCEMAAVLRRGCHLLREYMDRPPQGLIAPCWRWGAAADPAHWPPGLDVALGFRSLWTRDGRRIPLRSYNRDFGCLSRPLWALLPRLLQGAGMPCVVIHPADVRRGLLEASLSQIDHLIEAGYEPLSLRAFTSVQVVR